jgi:hypothetical protein
MFSRGSAVSSALGLLMLASLTANGQVQATPKADVVSNWSLESSFKIGGIKPGSISPGFEARNWRGGDRDDSRHGRGNDRDYGNRRDDDDRARDHRGRDDDRRDRGRDDRSHDRCTETLRSIIELDGRCIEVEVQITEECGLLTARVELQSARCSRLPDIDSISLRVRGCETVSFRLDRLCNKGSPDRLVFVSTCGERFRGSTGHVDLRIETHCDSDRVTWRSVKVN